MEKKPKTIPAEAIWNKKENEWELGKVNEKGDCIGEWKWWLAPNGHLCCHTFFDDNGKMISCKRFHPNGEVSLELFYNENKKEQRIYHKSKEDTDEYFPRSPYKNTHTAHMKASDEWYFYDEKGKLLNPVASESTEDLEELKEGKDNETAAEAVERLEKVIALIKANKDIGERAVDTIEEYYEPYFQQITTEEILKEITKYEEEYGIKYPPSYKNFVLEKGLFKLGKDSKRKNSLFTNFEYSGSRMSGIPEWEFGWDLEEEGYTKEDIERLGKIIAFSGGDEHSEEIVAYGFDFNTLNPETGEVSVEAFYVDAFGECIHDEIQVCKNKGFDKHITTIIDRTIEEMLDDLSNSY